MAPAIAIVHWLHPTPIGRLLLVAHDGVLSEIQFDDRRQRVPAQSRLDPTPFAAVMAQLDEYFAGSRRGFELAWRTVTGSAFERAVWQALVDIPYGTTASYGAVAARVGQPGGARAVGVANGRNPLPILVPCHRVIGSDGTLVGFGGGLALKRRLLELEGALAPQPLQLTIALRPEDAG